MQHFLAIDQGTSGTKAIVVDDAGQVVSIAEVEVRPEYLAAGGVEQDPEALFASVVTAGRQALAQAGVPVAAVALANQGETVLAWDRYGYFLLRRFRTKCWQGVRGGTTH